ncbi:probable 3-hydroxyacyl-CoA dehydrogenase [Serendipita indica DSM 11827]|uniref:Probable 3-hydroxyacyl-CoA dehydrogenase n=1 Tax=Serendipita indica (strain DSM 11827) TaxID=1109443 RepID=G4T7A7_SERID|nr:probable 3-hydroxyacyl-CoA dehydrogenase [Serendipita indica DSM 11827]
MKIENRTFIVSGGSSGLGLATCAELAKCGAYVATLDIQDLPDAYQRGGGDHIRYFKADLTRDSEIAEAVSQAVKWSKETGAKLGGVINCGGVATAAKMVTSDGTPHSLDLFEFALNINVVGTFNLTRRVLEHLVHIEPEGKDGERGIVIMVASAAAFEGQQGQVAYAASKGAVRAMTLPMARDLGRFGIRVNTIAPSLFISPMTERMSEKVHKSLERELVFPRRFGEPEEFAHTCKMVIESTYLNGETIRLSGGARMPGRL